MRGTWHDALMSRALTDLCDVPIVQAPMAGGGSCPPLAAAVSDAGGLGFLAAGYKTADGMYQEITQLRALTSRPFGVNLFLPQPELADPATIEVYRHQLAGEAAWYETPLGDCDLGQDDNWDAKLAILLDDPVPLVSFTFGCPTAEVIDSFHRVGTRTAVTVTTPEEARAAEEAGADALCVQGIEAGGHQGTHRDDPERDGAGFGLLTLLTLVREAVHLPMIAAGGIMRGEQIAAAVAAGAQAAQLGTAFLVCPESGAPLLHKQSLGNPLFTRTELTRAFSGRPARGLVNRFLREHGPYAPAAYPQVHHVTSPLRKAAARTGDAQGMALWAGQGHRLAREMPAAQLVEVLAAETAAAVLALGGPSPTGGIR